jgi:hypothetical protein
MAKVGFEHHGSGARAKEEGHSALWRHFSLFRLAGNPSLLLIKTSR